MTNSRHSTESGHWARARRTWKRARVLRAALQLEPQNASAHNGLGNVLFFEGQFDAAIKEMDAALR